MSTIIHRLQRSLKFRHAGIFLGVAAAIVVVARLTPHSQAQDAQSEADAAPTAGVAKVTRGDLFKTVTIPAEFRPFEEVELHAKVAGFLQKITVDFGDKVKAGQLLATLEVPELQAELSNAQAAVQRTGADYTNAHLIYTRLLTVNRDHPNLVAQQDLDTASTKDQTTSAALAAAKAEAEKYRSLVGYTRITAPFDGVITRRYADPGALIQAGTASDTQSRPVVRIADNYRLRLDFPVSVDYVKDIHEGDVGEVRVESLNNKTFSGTISRFAHEVNDQTRTMTTEIEVTNGDLELVPGMYATVVLKTEKHADALALPTQAVALGKSPTVLVVNQDGQVEERPVQLGLETPDKYEVLSGVHEGEMVIIGNRSAFRAGERVEPKLVQLSLRHDD